MFALLVTIPVYSNFNTRKKYAHVHHIYSLTVLTKSYTRFQFSVEVGADHALSQGLKFPLKLWEPWPFPSSSHFPTRPYTRACLQLQIRRLFGIYIPTSNIKGKDLSRCPIINTCKHVRLCNANKGKKLTKRVYVHKCSTNQNCSQYDLQPKLKLVCIYIW